MRLQCYEGLDEAKALYEWNYRKQLLRIQAEAEGTGWQAVQDDIFGEEFLLARPLLQAIASPEPVVLLIDEIDKTDQEFEAMLLELLSDFQISIPELGRIEARTHPVVLLTSNNSRELTEALKRRCLYLWLDYPTAERELEIVHLHAPELPETVARRLVEVVAMVRELDLKKPPSIAESIDWARALLLLGAQDIDQKTFRDTLSIIVKHRTDLDTVADRVGVRLRRVVTLPRHLIGFAEALRTEGVAIGTSELNDAFAALGEVEWTRRDAVQGGARGHAGQVARRPPRLRPRLRALLLPRHRERRARGRRARGSMNEEGAAGRRADRLRRAARADPRGHPGRRRGRAARPRAAGDRRLRPPRRGQRRARRRRPAHPARARPEVRAAAAWSRARAPSRSCRSRATRSAPSRPTCGASSSARRSSARRRCRRHGR